MPYFALDLSKIKTYSLAQRASRVALADLITPETPLPKFENPELGEVAQRIAAACCKGAPVICMLGGHVIKRGLAPLLIDLMERGAITHLASNGAATIHDFEIAFMGQTSEDVATSLVDGSFGMAEETGAFMNRAIRAGASRGMGIGEALGKWMAEDERFRYRQNSLVYNAYRLGIPYTVHVAVGTDIIHQHPLCDFAALGWASGQDFKIFCASVSQLESGVFCNFGSAVIGPEVFLKAISIVRNLGYNVKAFTTANFDLVPLTGNYREPVGDDVTEYYYRPRKNIVNRPVKLGGKGYHICGDHRVTIPNLASQVRTLLKADAAGAGMMEAPRDQGRIAPPLNIVPSEIDSKLSFLWKTYPFLKEYSSNLLRIYEVMVRCALTGGTLHIGAEKDLRLGRTVQANKLRIVLLGYNPLFHDNTRPSGLPDRARTVQELEVMARPGDLLICICPEGETDRSVDTARMAQKLGLPIVALTGPSAVRLNGIAEISIQLGSETKGGAPDWAETTLGTLLTMAAMSVSGEERGWKS